MASVHMQKLILSKTMSLDAIYRTAMCVTEILFKFVSAPIRQTVVTMHTVPSFLLTGIYLSLPSQCYPG